MTFSVNQVTVDRNRVFRRACELAGIPATRRQASRWNKGRGKAYQFRNAAQNSFRADKDQDDTSTS